MLTQATLWLTLVVCLPGVALAQSATKDKEALAQQVVAALKAKDQQSLQRLSIDAEEFKKYIWPTIAGRLSDGHTNQETFFAMYNRGSAEALEKHLSTFGGKPFEVVKITTGPDKQYKGYRVLSNPEVTMRGSDGQEQILKLGSALLEHDGIVKVANYFRTPTTGR